MNMHSTTEIGESSRSKRSRPPNILSTRLISRRMRQLGQVIDAPSFDHRPITASPLPLVAFAHSTNEVGSSSNRRMNRPPCIPPNIPAARRSRRARKFEGVFAAASSNDIPTAASVLPPANDCSKCNATKFAYESAHFCCCDGDVQLAATELPSEILNLFGGVDERAMHFQRYVRLYNNMFAFGSLGGNTREGKWKSGIYVFKLLGHLYHYQPDLLPGEKGPEYLQLYFYDAEHEMGNRSALFGELRSEIIAILMAVMERNPYATFFRSLKEVRSTYI